MTFFAHTVEPTVDKALKRFTYKTGETGGGQARAVEAHYVSFAHDHVTFWLEAEPLDFLVLAEVNSDVRSLKEEK